MFIRQLWGYMLRMAIMFEDDVVPSGGGSGVKDGVGRIPAEGADAPKTDGPVAEDKGFVVPDAYKESGIAKKVKSADDLWKTAVNLDKLAGKKLDIPDWDNATDEQREQFFNRLRPETADAYELPEGILEENAAPVKEMLHKVGLSNYQAKKLTEQYLAWEQSRMAKQFDKDGFVDEMKKSFGDNYEPAVKEATATMRAHLSDADKAMLEKLPNSQLSIMYRFAKNMADAYGAKETGAQIGGGETKAGAVDVSARRAELLKKIQTLNTRPHTAQEKQSLLKEYNDLTTRVTAGKAGK